MLPKKYRLTRRSDFDHLFKKGRSVGNKFLSLKYLKKEDSLRIAFVISNKSEKSAVERNRVRRQAREVVRPLLPSFKSGYDLIFLFKKPFVDLDFAQKAEQMNKLIKQARLLS